MIKETRRHFGVLYYRDCGRWLPLNDETQPELKGVTRALLEVEYQLKKVVSDVLAVVW